jgi:hypothetical protein
MIQASLSEQSLPWKDIITVLIAVYGAVLSTYTFLATRRRDKPNIIIEVTTDLRGDMSRAGLMITLNALNVGHRPITLSMMGFLLPDGQIMDFIRPQTDVEFPYKLESGERCRAWMEVERFKANLMKAGYYQQVELVGYFRDEVNRIYKSNKWVFNTDHW